MQKILHIIQEKKPKGIKSCSINELNTIIKRLIVFSSTLIIYKASCLIYQYMFLKIRKNRNALYLCCDDL